MTKQLKSKIFKIDFFGYLWYLKSSASDRLGRFTKNLLIPDIIMAVFWIFCKIVSL